MEGVKSRLCMEDTVAIESRVRCRRSATNYYYSFARMNLARHEASKYTGMAQHKVKWYTTDTSTYIVFRDSRFYESQHLFCYPESFDSNYDRDNKKPHISEFPVV